MTPKLKDMVNQPKYSAVLLDQQSQNKLAQTLTPIIPPGWKVFAHHMTIDPFGLVDERLVGQAVALRVTHIGKSDKAIAVKVSGYNGKTNNAFPHVTVAVNVAAGAKPKDSNGIREWIDIDEHSQVSIDNPHLYGTIQNL
jgi:hypothetical protein